MNFKSIFFLLSFVLTSTAFGESLFIPSYNDRVSVDRISGTVIPKIKIQTGVDGSATDVSASNPLPVTSTPSGGGAWTQTTASVTTAGANASAAKARKYLLVVNKGTDTIYLKSGANPSAGQGVPIPAGGNYEPLFPPSADVYLKAASGTQSYELIEG